MPTTYDRVDFAPPQPKGSGKSFALAAFAHLLLIAALTWGVNWHAEDNSGVTAELWSAVPQEAAPRLVTPDPTPIPPTPPKPIPTPEPRVDPKPVPPEPKVDPTPNRDAEIAMEQEKKKRELQKQEEARVQQAKIEKAKQDKAREDQAKADKAEKAKQDKLKADQLAKAEQAKQDADDKKKDLAKKAADEKRAAAAQEAERQRNLARIAGMAGATGGENARGNALQSSGPSAGYAGRIRARVKPNIVFTDDVDGNPTAEVEVRTAPDGTIVGQRLIKSSGSKSWDDAVVKAIIKTETLPRDTDGRVPSSLVIAFRPKD